MLFDLRNLARALGGEVSGQQVLAPGPGHSPHDRSLAIRLSADAPDGFVLHSHAGDSWRACRDYVRGRLGLPSWEPGDGREAQRTIPPNFIQKWDFAVIDAEAEERHRTEDDLVRIARARAIWDDGIHPRGTGAERYLVEGRALTLTDDLVGSVLRFHPRCPWRNENTGRTEFIPALLAAFRSIDDGTITAIHRIRVDQPERWPKTDRRMLGVVHRAAVMLAPAAERLAVGEGVETCMAARQLGDIAPAVWALGSVGAVSFFPVIEGVRELVLLAEAGQASANATQVCARRWQRAGRRVFLARSNVGKDHNDFLLHRRGAR